MNEIDNLWNKLLSDWLAAAKPVERKCDCDANLKNCADNCQAEEEEEKWILA
jgi:hypothetical protein